MYTPTISGNTAFKPHFGQETTRRRSISPNEDLAIGAGVVTATGSAVGVVLRTPTKVQDEIYEATHDGQALTLVQKSEIIATNLLQDAAIGGAMALSVATFLFAAGCIGYMLSKSVLNFVHPAGRNSTPQPANN